MLNTEIKFGEVHTLDYHIEPNSEKVQFKNIFSNENGGVVLVGFKKGQKLDTHTAPAELMVTVLEGEIEFTMLDRPHNLKKGEFLLVGANVAHSVEAMEDSKMMLVKVRP